MNKKIMILVAFMLVIVTATSSVEPVSAAVEVSGSITRGGSGVLSGHYVKTTLEWKIDDKKTKVKSSTATQSEKGAFSEAKGVKKQSALSTEKKHVYYSKTKFTFGIVTAWGSIAINTESYTDKVTLNGNGSASVDWGI